MIKFFATALAVSVITAGCYDNSAPTEAEPKEKAMEILTEEQKKDGWQLLFDGKTMSGWHKYGGDSVGSAWKVADGTFYLDTTERVDWQIKGGGDIVTDSSFENFHLKLEWKIAKDGNSGIMFYVHEDTTKYKWGWETAPEMQILDNAGHADAKIIKHRAGDLYDLISCSKETVKPHGEWNQAEVKCVNGKLDLFLNGENVVSTTMWDDNWKKMVAGSKFAKMPDFGMYKKGKIGLQDHGNTVWYRNVMIKKL
ncbi:glycosyl hydrolase [Chitinophagaceae bacterium IBVUCB2]|nr:glycosyl hydrolase [Chitinophagaceae bacterium IBVUCB2]